MRSFTLRLSVSTYLRICVSISLFVSVSVCIYALVLCEGPAYGVVVPFLRFLFTQQC